MLKFRKVCIIKIIKVNLIAEVSSYYRKKMKTVIYTNRFSILSLLGRQKEADEVFSEGEKLMAEAKFINELYRLYDIKVGISEERGKIYRIKLLTSFQIIFFFKSSICLFVCIALFRFLFIRIFIASVTRSPDRRAISYI